MSERKSRLVANRAEALRAVPPHPPGPGDRPMVEGPRPKGAAEGLALPDEDAGAVAARFAAFEEELNPRGEVGRFLVRRAALLSVRLDRCARHEAAMASRRVRDARSAHADERMAYIEKMGEWLAAEPATHVRRLKAMPEGVDWLIRAWLAVKSDLFHPTRDVWNHGHRYRIDNLMGRTPEQFPASPVDPLCKAAWGDFSELAPEQGGGLAAPARKAWAREELGKLIDAEVAALEALRPTLDDAAIEKDRAEAGRRALFDASREAILARRHEAAAERGLYRALRELRAVEGRPGEGESPPVDGPGPGPGGATSSSRGSLASFFHPHRMAEDIPDEGRADVGRWGRARGEGPPGEEAPAPRPHRQR